MLELNLDFGSTDSALEKLKNSKNRLSRDQIRQKNSQKESRSKFSSRKARHDSWKTHPKTD